MAPRETLGEMLAAALVVAANWSMMGAGPEPGEDRAVFEVTGGAEVLYPPAIKEPRAHPGYGLAAGASLRKGDRFKAIVGFGVEHTVRGWLGDPEEARTVTAGRFAGTVPQSFRGELIRMAPLVRVGLENDLAYGFFGLSPGYALRIAGLSCAQAGCRVPRSVEHGLNLGLSMGAVLYPSKRVPVYFGGEVGLDWAFFPRRHPGLAAWSQGMSARALGGWRF